MSISRAKHSPTRRSIPPGPIRPLGRLAMVFTIIACSLAAVGIAPASATARASMNGAGDVIITGTNGGDLITVFGEGPSQVGVSIRSGEAMSTYSFSNVRRDIIINSRRGSDRVTLHNVGVARDLRVNTGNGTNSFKVEFTSIGRDLRFTDGPGNTLVDIGRVDVERNGHLLLGSGVHTVDIAGSNWKGSHRMTTSSRGSLELSARRTDIFGPFSLISGNRGDVIELDEFTRFWSNATFNLRGGHDTLLWDRTNMQTPSTLLRILTGSGDDAVFLEAGELSSSFNVDLGSGDDRGGMSEMNLSVPGLVNGGPGIDEFLSSMNVGGPITFRNVERAIGIFE